MAEPRERYHELLARPQVLEDILQAGAIKARAIATPFLAELREAVGLRSFVGAAASQGEQTKKVKKATRTVSFRDDEGFRFRVLNAAGEDVLLSKAFADGRSAGQALKALQSGEAVLRVQDLQVQMLVADELVAQSAVLADAAACELALTAVAECIVRDE